MTNILVIGSKPKSTIPKIKVHKVYTANGSAELGKKYRQYYPKTMLICLAGKREFEKNFRVKNRIIKANPKRLYIRMGKIDLPNKLKKTKLEYKSKKFQILFQSKFFNFGIFTLILSEFFWGRNLYQKIKHIARIIKHNTLQGVSTGFYSILLALHENPNSKIIISGIGMQGGVQFYKSQRSKVYEYSPRARVDRFMIYFLKKKFKRQLYSTDEEFSKLAGIKNLNSAKLFNY